VAIVRVAHGALDLWWVVAGLEPLEELVAAADDGTGEPDLPQPWLRTCWWNHS